MTQIHKNGFKCVMCGNESTHSVLMSTNIFGWPVPETRLSEMPRSTIHAWIQRCPSCGYCAPDISKIADGALEIVESNSYRKQLEATDFPELANTFLCWSLIRESSEQFSDAGWASTYAAWACDDRDYVKSAQLCRMRSAHLFLRVEHQKALIEKRDSSDAKQSAALLRKLFQKMREKGIKKKIFTREELDELIEEVENDSRSK